MLLYDFCFFHSLGLVGDPGNRLRDALFSLLLRKSRPKPPLHRLFAFILKNCAVRS